MDIMNKFMNPNGDGMYGKASQFLGKIEDRKNELFNPETSTLGALGFGQRNFDLPGVGLEIPKIEEMRAADTAKMATCFDITTEDEEIEVRKEDGATELFNLIEGAKWGNVWAR